MVMHREPGTFPYSEYVTIPGLQRATNVLRCARETARVYLAFFACISASAFGQKAGGSAIAWGARANQSSQTSVASQRWQASTIWASSDTPVGQEAE